MVKPEQIPGSLFVLLTAWVGMSLGMDFAVLVLALGCAAGWMTFHPDNVVKAGATLAALVLWALAFVLILWRVL